MKNFLFILLLFVFVLGCKGKQKFAPAPPPHFSPAPAPSPIPNNNNFNSSVKIVVYDFWAPWCGPCKAFAPTFEQWKNKYGNSNISFVKINVDEDPSTAKKFGIESIPTVVVTKNGQVTGKFVGAPSENAIVNLLK